MGDHVSKKQLQRQFHLKGNASGGGRGCCTKCFGGKFTKKDHGNYRNNGYDEISGDSAKAGYYKPDQKRLKKLGLHAEVQHGLTAGRDYTGQSIPLKLMPRSPLADGSGWGFSETPKFRGKKNYQNANVPFAHQYHHMIPWEALSAGAFETEELKFLQKAEYNLNQGFNLIILPMRERVAEILMMYTHPNDHPDYSVEVAQTITRVKNKMNKGPKVHLDEESAKVMKDTLENWEKAEFEELMESGKANFPFHVNTHKPTSMTAAFRQAMKAAGVA